MDNLNKSLEATHIDQSGDVAGSVSTSVLTANAINPEILMAMAQRTSATNFDSDSENEAEDRNETNSTEEKASNHKSKKAEKERKLGRKSMKKKEFAKAEKHFEKAIDLNPKEVAYFLRLAEAKYAQHKYEECVELCNRAIKVGKENKGNVKLVASSMALRGRARKAQGKLDEVKTDVEKANKFLTSIALVKLEKGKYYEAFDFFNEAFQGHHIYSIFSIKYDDRKKDYMQFLFLFQVCVKYLEEYTKSFMSSCQDEAELQRHKVLLETEQLAVDLLKQKDENSACIKYTKIFEVYPREITCFITNQTKKAEGNKKWNMCYQLSCFLISIVFNIDSSTLEQDIKETLNEVRVLRAKALRRIYKFDEAADKRFLDELATLQDREGDEIIMTKELWNVLHPGMPSFPFEVCAHMSDFMGNGEVTVKEFNLFTKSFLETKPVFSI